MALNVRPALEVAAGSRRFITWGRERSAHPETITAAHLPELRDSDAFFARKIDRIAHPEVPDLLDELAVRRGSPAG
jgi:hypothetical protein